MPEHVSGNGDADADPGGHVEVVGSHDTGRSHRSGMFNAGQLRSEKARPWLNAPNLLTGLRLLLIPVILGLLIVGSQVASWWAFATFVFAAVTDTVDGWVARRWHGVTRWGQLADPIADKLLIIGTLSALAALDRLPWWAVIVIAFREVGVTLLRVHLIEQHEAVMPASRWGKAKTLSQVTAVALFLLPAVAEMIRVTALYIAVGLTVVSGIDYAFRAGRLVREGESDDEPSQ
ncbi:MAG: CDP-diacylglycerol--glycerol-3-phosphate 3-phosphatidyltransferase [Actinomycetota bacterium]|nr:CDP-diacylglycerol--glycerol-3-phosphate 3-phosphatidyltransferase [Actinomycetota bacterium]